LKPGATVQFSMAVAAQLDVSLNGAVDGHGRHRQERCAITSPRRLATRARQRDHDYEARRWSIATVLSQGDHSCIPIRAMVWSNGRAGTK
jgi:hypothetical protein